MVGYLSRIVSRLERPHGASGETVDHAGVMPPPALPDTPGVDPFEMVVPDEGQEMHDIPATPPVQEIPPPPPHPLPPAPALFSPAPVFEADSGDPVVSPHDEHPIDMPVPLPARPAPAPREIVTERIITIERDRADDARPSVLPPPAPPAAAFTPAAAPAEPEDHQPLPAVEPPAPRLADLTVLSSPSGAGENDRSDDGGRDIMAPLHPPQAEPVAPPELPRSAEPTSITVGNVIVEIVTTQRPAESRRAPAPPAPRRVSAPAARPGVRSKRGYGIGQR